MRRTLFLLPFVTLGLAALPARAADRDTDEGKVICECPAPSATPPPPTTRSAPLPPAATPRPSKPEEYQDHGSPRLFEPPATPAPETPGMPVPSY